MVRCDECYCCDYDEKCPCWIDCFDADFPFEAELPVVAPPRALVFVCDRCECVCRVTVGVVVACIVLLALCVVNVPVMSWKESLPASITKELQNSPMS